VGGKKDGKIQEGPKILIVRVDKRRYLSGLSSLTKGHSNWRERMRPFDGNAGGKECLKKVECLGKNRGNKTRTIGGTPHPARAGQVLSGGPRSAERGRILRRVGIDEDRGTPRNKDQQKEQ